MGMKPSRLLVFVGESNSRVVRETHFVTVELFEKGNQKEGEAHNRGFHGLRLDKTMRVSLAVLTSLLA